MDEYQEAYAATVQALDATLRQFSRSVPKPVSVYYRNASAYRYSQKSDRQALVAKCARLLSSLRSIHCLIINGLSLDAGAIMRVSDETSTGIMFLAAPRIFGIEPEPIHERYLAEFFQEEFDVGAVLVRTKRDRVPRSKIISYISRAYSTDRDIYTAKTNTELIEGAFSGFVHGAAGHIMDIFDGRDFVIPLEASDEPLMALTEQFGHYIQRTIIAFCHTSLALERRELFDRLYALNRRYFKDDGTLRSD